MCQRELSGKYLLKAVLDRTSLNFLQAENNLHIYRPPQHNAKHCQTLIHPESQCLHNQPQAQELSESSGLLNQLRSSESSACPPCPSSSPVDSSTCDEPPSSSPSLSMLAPMSSTPSR